MPRFSAVLLGVVFLLFRSHAVMGQQHYTYTNQFLSPVFDWRDTLSRNTIVIDGLAGNGSNAVQNGFLFTLLNAGYIDQQAKDRVKRSAGKYIKYEDRLRASVFYKHYIPKARLHILLGYQYNNSRNVITTKDAFRLAFEGNTSFENQWANIGNLFFENYQYNQYSIGFVKTVEQMEAGINVSFLQGINSQQLKNESGQLYTAPLGEYLDIAHQFQFNQSAGTRFFDKTGFGYSVDLHIAYTFKKFKLAFDVADLGAITWRKYLTNYQTRSDTTVHFEGVTVHLPNLINGGQQININADSLFAWLNVNQSSQRFVTLLPTSFQFTASIPAKIKKTPINVNVMLRTKLLSRYYAWVMLKTNFYLAKNFVVAPSVSAGGYSPFAIGLDAGWQSKHFNIFLGSDNLLGTAIPKYYPGSSVHLRLAAKF